MPTLAYTPTEATHHTTSTANRSIPFHTRAAAPQRTISVPITPTYLAQASAYHNNSLASPVHSRKPSRGTPPINLSDSLVDAQPDLQLEEKHRDSLKRTNALHRKRKQPSLHIRTAAPYRDAIPSSLSTSRLPPETPVDDSALETGEAFTPMAFMPQPQERTVAEKLARAWPWSWRPRVLDEIETRNGRLRVDGGLPRMVAGGGERWWMKVLVGLVGAVVVLQVGLMAGVGGC